MLPMPARVTAAEALATRRVLAEALARESGRDVVVDASSLQHFDSSALAVLLACQRLADAAGKSFTIRGMPSKLASLASLYGVDKLLMPQAIPATP